MQLLHVYYDGEVQDQYMCICVGAVYNRLTTYLQCMINYVWDENDEMNSRRCGDFECYKFKLNALELCLKNTVGRISFEKKYIMMRDILYGSFSVKLNFSLRSRV